MQEEFLELTQGSMKVAEYHKKFLELSRFVGDLNPSDEFLTRRFIKGLNGRLRQFFSRDDHRTVQSAYEEACNLSQIQEELRGEYEPRKRKEMSVPTEQMKRLRLNDGGYQDKGRGRNRQTQERRQTFPDGAERHFYCKSCNKNHPGKDCDGNLVKCHFCEKMGHKMYECYKNPASKYYKGDKDAKGGPRADANPRGGNYRGNGGNYRGNGGNGSGNPRNQNRAGGGGASGGNGREPDHINVMSQAEANARGGVIEIGRAHV